jgi:polyribonucleotide nucleotidyltransferase
VFDAKISRIEDYGLFVDLPRGKRWLCHVSALGQKFSDKLENHFNIGQVLPVVVSEIDNMGRIKVKRKL